MKKIVQISIIGVIIIMVIGLVVFLQTRSLTLKLPATYSISPTINYSSQFKEKMNLTSPHFQNNEYIPEKFTCEGLNVSPELRIEDMPKSAKSLALIVDDPDAPGATFVHWLLWNIDLKTTVIPSGNVPSGSVQGRTSFDKPGYGGPCPPPGKPHHYYFKLYALDSILNLPPSARASDLESEIQKYMIASAELVGLYKRESVLY